jgi:uncharacterized protein
MSYRGLNVLGAPIKDCSLDPLTGFTRSGCCETGPQDTGSHTVCSIMTDEFLTFSQSRGNDLSTPAPQWAFPGLIAGDRWCLCAQRWLEAYGAGCAPLVVLESTHEKALDIIPLAALREYALGVTSG